MNTPRVQISGSLSLWLALGCLGALSISNVDAQIGAQTKRAAACATCHIDWMPDFSQKNVETLVPLQTYVVVKTGKQKISSTRRMCFTCHDGFVNDSRFQFREGAHEHPIGVKPSKKIRRLESEEGAVYPLNEDGKLYCGTCHTAHGNNWNKSESALFMRSKNVNSSMCIDCHAQEGSKGTGNHPMERYKDRMPKGLLSVRSVLGKDREVICQTCHRSHHTTSDKLLVMNNKKSKLCISCHRDQKNIVGSKHDISTHKNKVTSAKLREIAEKGPCAGCHVTHKGSGKSLLTTAKGGNRNDVLSQCLACHSKGGIAGEAKIGEFSHPVDVSIDKVNIDVRGGVWKSHESNRKLQTLPLFNKHGKLVKDGGNVQCPTCHDTHGVGGKNKDFLRIKQGGKSELCVNCHIRQARIYNSKHNVNLYDKDKRRKIHAKGKKSEGVCYTCHKTHNSKLPNMLTLVDKISDNSNSLIGSICGHCHKNNGAASDSVIGKHSHPMSIALPKEMSSSELPLFTSFGNRVKAHERGRIDCATCHDVHQWDADDPNSTAGRDLKAPAHGGNSFLRISSDGDAGLCTSCHAKQGQVIGTDHDFRISAKWMKNIKQLDVAQTGVCGQCHTAHDAASQVALWSRKPGKAEDAQTSFCRSCHVKDHRATNKIIAIGKHPEDVFVWSTPRRIIPGLKVGEALPVFTIAGNKEDIGIIACPSCHDVHQWNGSHYGKGPGRETEGSSVTSFLRKTTVGNIVCADCHGLDALFRYQYFHSKTTTRNHPLYIDLKQEKKYSKSKNR